MLAHVKKEARKELNLFKTDRRGYAVATFTRILPILVVMAVFALGVAPAAAQDPVTLDLDATELTNGLFNGANIIIAALGAIMFLMAGFRLGGILLRGIVNAVGNIKF